MKIIFAGILLSSLAPLAALHAAEAKPNIVLILADDLGWGDLACNGADLHETPHLDRLAQQGMRFTDAYGMSVCGKKGVRTLFQTRTPSTPSRSLPAATPSSSPTTSSAAPCATSHPRLAARG